MQPNSGVAFVGYERLLPFLADNPERTRLTTTTQPEWFEAAWQRLFPDFDAYVFEGREEVPPAITLLPRDGSRGRIVLQYVFADGHATFSVIVTREGRTLWLEQKLAPHDVAPKLSYAIDVLREPPTQRSPVTPRRVWEPSQRSTTTTKPPVDLRAVPLAQVNVPSWWDMRWVSPEFNALFLPGNPNSRLSPPTIVLEFKSDERFEIRVRDFSDSPWRETWAAPGRPVQILVEFKSQTILEQRLARDKLRVRPALQLAIRKLQDEVATRLLQEQKPQLVDLPPPSFFDMPLRPPRQAPPVPPAEVDITPAPALTQSGLFGPFTSLLDKTDPADETDLGKTGVQLTYIAGNAQGPPVAMFRRTERALDPTEVEPSKEDRILVTWFGGRWKRKRFPQQPYNVRVYFTNRLLAESDVASVQEAWRLVQKANADLATKRRRVDVADLKFKPLKIKVNSRDLVLDPATVEKIRAVIAVGNTYMFKYRGEELYGVRKGKKPKVISVPYGDTKPVYVKSLDAWVGLIKAVG
jgi:hypothetical protein